MTDMQIGRARVRRRQHYTTQQNTCTEEKNNPMGREFSLSVSDISGLLARFKRILLHGED
jgi:hypothetical protein